jgi:hypothetical protein
MLFVNATWYNNYADVEKLPGLNSTILDQFYDAKTDGSFQFNLLYEDA